MSAYLASFELAYTSAKSTPSLASEPREVTCAHKHGQSEICVLITTSGHAKVYTPRWYVQVRFCVAQGKRAVLTIQKLICALRPNIWNQRSVMIIQQPCTQ